MNWPVLQVQDTNMLQDYLKSGLICIVLKEPSLQLRQWNMIKLFDKLLETNANVIVAHMETMVMDQVGTM